MELTIVLISLLISISVQTANCIALTDGLYVSNGTDILLVDVNNPSSARSVYTNPYGRIVGLTYDHRSEYLYWSDVAIASRGIYRGKRANDGSIDATRIISTDILEVNGLTFDWISKNLYWTDGRKRTIEMASTLGTSFHRRILIMDHLNVPRGIYADPKNGYLFWNDQGSHKIERSRLDGSDRMTIVTNVTLPNQMVVYDSKLYWVDSNQKTFESSGLDGSNRGQLAALKGRDLAGEFHIFGLGILNGKAYISNWKVGNIIRVDCTGSNAVILNRDRRLGTDAMFSVAYVSATNQPTAGVTDVCASQGCSHICLPSGANSARCSCPSFGGLVLNDDSKTCSEPTNILLYAIADQGYVGFYPNPATYPTKKHTDRYFVGRSLRPVGVAYDPINKAVYWSDVAERAIYKVNLDGKRQHVFLRSGDGIGIVDGMILDHKRRQLYYTNMGSMTVNDNKYSWHKVETVALDSTSLKIRTIVTTAEKPRAMTIDFANGHLYYTDWGNRAMIMRVELDGSNPTIIRSGLDNPNGITILGNKIYFVDSHFKNRDSNNPNYPDKGKKGSLYSIDMDGSGFNDVLKGSLLELATPFGLSSNSDANLLYVSDWDNNDVVVVQPNGINLGAILEDSTYVMSLLYTKVQESRELLGSNPCASTSHGCSDICLSSAGNTARCSCNSYKGKALQGNTTCSDPSNFLIVADMNSIKLVSLDGKDQSTYSPVQGIPFISNFAGMTFDPATRTIYYSDISSKTIYAYNFVNKTVVYRINHVIDGMAIYKQKLYWTDFTNNLICFLDLDSNPVNRTHTVFLSQLKRPRAIKIHNEKVYWTEWGADNPRVASVSLESKNKSITVLLDANSGIQISWPNGIFLDQSHIYIGDGFKTTRKIIRCDLRGQSCVVLADKDQLEHVYDLWVLNGVVYFTDWINGTVSAFSRNSTFPVVQGLMRPTQMFVSYSNNPPSACPSDNECTKTGGTCSLLLGNAFTCTCANNMVQSVTKTSCVDPTQSSNQCSANNKSYRYGDRFVLDDNVCTSCQCLAGQSLSVSPLSGAVCERQDCPKPDCPEENASVKTLPGQCCPVCSQKCSLVITDCPKAPVNMILPKTQDYVVHEYLPSVMDCLKLSREITQTKKPIGDIYKWQDGNGPVDVTITVSAKSTQPGHAKDEVKCKFTVIVTDVTPPIITCPNDIIVNTFEDRADSVRWNPPQVYDNVGVKRPPQLNISTKAAFEVGDTFVRYTVQDKAGLKANCTFKVTVNKLIKKGTGKLCSIPRVQNGHMACQVGESSFSCQALCDNGYLDKKLAGPNSTITCDDGTWIPAVPESFEDQNCLKPTNKTVTGMMDIKASEGCSAKIDLQYTEDYTQNTIQKKNYLGESRFALKSKVKASGCSKFSKRKQRDADNDIIVNIAITGQYSNHKPEDKTDLESDIQKILEKIREEMKTGFTSLAIKSDKGVTTLGSPEFASITWSYVCPPGQIKDSATEECALCPPGTFQSSISECTPCQNGTYNDEEGMSQCKPCPSLLSPPGSKFKDQCSPVDLHSEQTVNLIEKNMKWIIIAGAGVVGFIIIIVVVVCLVRRRRNNFPISDSHLYKNKLYNEDDETYDRIADNDDLPLNGDASKPKNPYEHPVQKKAAAENDYEQMATGGNRNSATGSSQKSNTSRKSDPAAENMYNEIQQKTSETDTDVVYNDIK